MLPPILRGAAQATGKEALSKAEEIRVVGLYGRPAEERMVYPWQLGS